MDHATLGGGATFAVLFETQVDRRHLPQRIADAVDDEPALQGIAPAPVAGPAQAALGGVMEGIALQVAVIAGLQSRQACHPVEFAIPAADADPQCRQALFREPAWP